MHRRHLIAILPVAALARPRPAAAAAGPVVVELFTSESCSSCPPADAALAELVESRTDVLALSWHVTYWNRLGWHDRFSLPEATERQRRYAASLGHGQVYTPQVVVQGRRDLVGSDRAALRAAIRAAQAERPASIDLGLVAEAGMVRVTIGEGAAGATPWLIGYDSRQATAVAGGENRGRQLVHANVVRAVVSLGLWQGTPASVQVPRPAGERLALLLQSPAGIVLAAARG